jgi:hypothetical protein
MQPAALHNGWRGRWRAGTARRLGSEEEEEEEEAMEEGEGEGEEAGWGVVVLAELVVKRVTPTPAPPTLPPPSRGRER